MLHLVKTAFAALFVSAVSAQDFEFLTTPQQKFAVSGGPVGDSNAVTISPDNAVVYVTRADGTLDGLDPETGEALAGFPISPGSFTGAASHSCNSGVFIHDGSAGANAFIVYSVITDEGNTFTAAISHPDGAVLWATEVPGIAEGTPVISALGDFVYLTHNQGAVGSFTVLDAANGGAVFYTEANLNGTIAYTAPAIYHNPAYGNYIGGFDPTPNNPQGLDNTNDILAWSATVIPFDSGRGQTFAFQLPTNFITGDDNTGFAVKYLTGTGWLSRNPPAIAVDGLRQYYGISRNSLRCWIPGATLRGRWDEAAIGTSNEPYGRGTPRFNDPPNTPTVNQAGSELYLGFASPVFASLVADVPGLDERWSKTLGSIVNTRAVLAHDESAVYFAESNPGVIHSTMTADGTDYFAAPLGDGATVSAEMSRSPDGTVLYFADDSGTVYGWAVGSTGPSPTMSPTTTPMPTALDTSTAPTGSPTITGMPTSSAMPTTSPTVTAAPTTASPTAASTPGDTTAPPDTTTPAPSSASTPASTPAETTEPPSAAPQATAAVLSAFAAFLVAFLL